MRFSNENSLELVKPGMILKRYGFFKFFEVLAVARIIAPNGDLVVQFKTKNLQTLEIQQDHCSWYELDIFAFAEFQARKSFQVASKTSSSFTHATHT